MTHAFFPDTWTWDAPMSAAEHVTPVLYAFSGLPGSGKTTLAKALATRLRAAYLRIDTVEQALRDICSAESIADEGYRLAYRIASDNLRLGLDAVADACNPIAITRRAWQRVAADAGARCVNIETTCSDAREHRQRMGKPHDRHRRTAPAPWQEIESREYQPWPGPVITVDTAGRSQRECFDHLLHELDAAL